MFIVYRLPVLRFLETIMPIVREWSVDRSPKLCDIDKNQLIDNPISKPIEKSSTKAKNNSQTNRKSVSQNSINIKTTKRKRRRRLRTNTSKKSV